MKCNTVALSGLLGTGVLFKTRPTTTNLERHAPLNWNMDTYLRDERSRSRYAHNDCRSRLILVNTSSSKKKEHMRASWDHVTNIPSPVQREDSPFAYQTQRWDSHGRWRERRGNGNDFTAILIQIHTRTHICYRLLYPLVFSAPYLCAFRSLVCSLALTQYMRTVHL